MTDLSKLFQPPDLGLSGHCERGHEKKYWTRTNRFGDPYCALCQKGRSLINYKTRESNQASRRRGGQNSHKNRGEEISKK